jgi:hypothetical protein
MKNSQAAANGELIKNDLTIINQADILQASMGQAGMVVVSDTTKAEAAAGTCFAVIKFLSDSVVTEIVADASAPITGTLDGLAFGANFALYGKFASVQLASGSAILYIGGV